MQIAKTDLPEGHWYTAVFQSNYGRCLFELERFDEAAQVLQGSYAGFSNSLGPNHERTIAVLRALVDVHASLNEPKKEAEYRELLREATERISELPD